jgi:hypothetical protein
MAIRVVVTVVSLREYLSLSGVNAYAYGGDRQGMRKKLSARREMCIHTHYSHYKHKSHL